MLVTDDEVAALAHLADGSWRRPLPTVDTSSIDSLRAAIARGLRSLELRGLISELHGIDVSLAPVIALVDQQPIVVALAVDSDGLPVPATERVEIYVLPDDSGAAVITASNGVHRVEPADPYAAAVELGGLLELSGEAEGNRFALLLRKRDGQLAEGYLGGESGVQVLATTATGRTAPVPVASGFDWGAVVKNLLRKATT